MNLSNMPLPQPPREAPVPLLARALDFLLNILHPLQRPLLLTVLFVAPLAAECAFPIPAFGCEVLLSLLLCSWLSLRMAAPVAAPLELAEIKWPVLLWAVIAVIQLVPLPLSWAVALSPLRQSIQEGTYSLLDPTLVPVELTASLAPERTLRGLFRLGLAFGLFAVVRDTMRERSQRRTLIHTLLLAGLLQVMIGIGHQLFEAEGILFIPGLRVETFPFFGTFVNVNRNAAYLNLLWPIAFSLVIESFIGRSEKHSDTNQLKRPGHGWLPWTFYAIAGTTLLLGAFFCRSRAAWAVVWLDILTLIFLGVARSGKPALALAGWFGSLGISLGLLAQFWRPLFEALSTLVDKPFELSRTLLWRAAGQMGSDHPLLGVGLGAFGDAFGPYNPQRQFGSAAYAENTYLETYAEFGVGGVVALVGLALAVGIKLYRQSFWAPKYGRRAVPGMVAALLGLALHGFSEQMPGGLGLMVPTMVVAGLLLATLKDTGFTAFDPVLRYGKPPARAWIPLLALPLLVGLSGMLNLGGHSALKAQEAIRTHSLAEVEPLLQRALAMAPLSPRPPQWLGTLRLQQTQELTSSMGLDRAETIEVLSQVSEDEQAIEYLSRAVVKAPLEGTPHRLLSQAVALQGDVERALALSREACRVQPSDYRNWLQRGRQALLVPASKRTKPKEPFTALRHALEQAPQNGLDAVIEQTLPVLLKVKGAGEKLRSPMIPWWTAEGIGRALAEQNRYADAAPWLELALSAPATDSSIAQRVGALAMKEKDAVLLEKAAAHLQQHFPDSDLADSYLAEARLQQGRLEEAIKLLEAAAPRSRQPHLMRLRIAQLLLNAQKDEEAEAVLLKLRLEQPYNIQVLMTLARLYQQKPQNRTRATELLRQAARYSPESEEPLYKLWLLHKEMGIELAAMQDMEQCLKLAKSPLCHAAAGREALRVGDKENAILYLSRSLEQKPDQPEVVTLLETAQKLGASGQ